MHIEPNRETTRIHLNSSERPKKTSEAKPQDEFVSTIAKLKAELIAADDGIRPEVVERGKELLESEAYPPEETVVRIANLLGERLATED